MPSNASKPFTRTLIAAGVGAVVTATLSAPALAEGPKRLDVASTFSTQNFLGEGAVHLSEELEKATGGEVSLRVHEPGDLVPAFEVFNSVSSGAVQAGWDWIGYWAGTVPITNLYGALPFGPTPEAFMSWMWAGEGTELLQKAYDPYGVKVLPCFISPQETGGWYNKEINKPEDFEGLSMRISGLGAKVLNKLGASTQLVPGSEIYLALERGRVDATEFSVPQVDAAMGFDEVAEYYYFPGWHQSASWFSLLINQQVWDEYSDERKAQFETACRATLQWAMAEAPPEQVRTIHQLEEKGVKVRRFPDEVISALQDAWVEVRQEEMQNNPDFKEAYESLMQHVKLIDEWYELQALPAPKPIQGENQPTPVQGEGDA
ncbi:TRAP transporter substrate-binding protein [Modicisalibacter xianhensis]|uniref:TRAP-type mannitol/chloroaromatic compound transport system, substrate-binding protein n=1 Tax=Modicisalibacter xianhensis TaxID=442341 RepID=A0A1I3AXC5_9GAMM|nr:TRAP transporter substrate-binding protein [Halomonas xianhensis]SFH54379.1 TRAP-type mannitol/chloroaromatic compound transport system, substrate-binding protein [Halomonas xianhensis]